MYADDGTYFQSSRKGAQRLMTAIDTICAAVGIIVKPTKSYVYSNTTGPSIVSTTYGAGENFKLGRTKRNTIDRIKRKRFFQTPGEYPEY